MAETFGDDEIRSSIRGKLNRNASELNTATQTIETMFDAVKQIATRVASLEADIGAESPVVDSDGTLTVYTYSYQDVFNYVYQDTGSSGQAFSKNNSVAGYKGAGYAELNNVTAVQGTCAIAYLNGFAPNANDPIVQQDRIVWLRVRGANGATIAGKSHSTGELGTATLTAANAWHWVKLNRLHEAYDNQFQLRGRSNLVQVDSIILTAVDNPDTPTGQDGFRSN